MFSNYTTGAQVSHKDKCGCHDNTPPTISHNTPVITQKDDYGNIIYDWRSPICSLFYDYEVGPCSYIAPMGKISGNIDRKRQYTIKDSKLLHIFDNNINIDDELLQEVLANESNDKMKNIVNTIQQEQNNVIRNVRDKTLIVSGIAGSGKTSVALHRIAFLLYKIKNLTSNDVLIFSKILTPSS